MLGFHILFRLVEMYIFLDLFLSVWTICVLFVLRPFLAWHKRQPFSPQKEKKTEQNKQRHEKHVDENNNLSKRQTYPNKNICSYTRIYFYTKTIILCTNSIFFLKFMMI